MSLIKRYHRVIIVAIAIIIAIAVSIFPLWSDYVDDITLYGIQFKTYDIEYTENIRITISTGRHRRYLFRGDRFEGYILIEMDIGGDRWGAMRGGYFERRRDGTIRSENIQVRLDGTIRVSGVDRYWRIYSEPDFSRILIDWNNPVDGHVFIATPAETRDQAVVVADEMLELARLQ